jgi:hypothetical protein
MSGGRARSTSEGRDQCYDVVVEVRSELRSFHPVPVLPHDNTIKSLMRTALAVSRITYRPNPPTSHQRLRSCDHANRLTRATGASETSQPICAQSSCGTSQRGGGSRPSQPTPERLPRWPSRPTDGCSSLAATGRSSCAKRPLRPQAPRRTVADHEPGLG